MSSLLQQLENNEAVLMMYIADELPADDRAEVEQLLSVDGGLRTELDRLRAAHESFASAMTRADAAAPLAVSQGVATRRVSRAIRQWQAQRVKPEPVVPPVRSGLRYPWWSYPVAAAAMLLLAYLAWWGNRSDSLDSGPRYGPDDNPPEIVRNDDAPIIAPSEVPDSDADLPRMEIALLPPPGLEEFSDAGLQDAERQLRALNDTVEVRGVRTRQ